MYQPLRSGEVPKPYSLDASPKIPLEAVLQATLVRGGNDRGAL